MKRNVVTSGLLLLLLAGCNSAFYQGYPDELYSSPSRSAVSTTPENERYLVSGSNSNNLSTQSNLQDNGAAGEATLIQSEPRLYLSFALATPGMYAAFASPIYYDWWYFYPYYIPPYWTFSSIWYWDWYYWNYPYYVRWHYPWAYNPWYWHWYYPPVVYTSPLRERINHRPEMVSLRQSMRSSITTKSGVTESKTGGDYGSGSISNRGSLAKPQPQVTTTSDTRPTRPTGGTGSATLSNATSTPIDEMDVRKPANNRGRITHTRDINHRSGTISTPIHTNQRLELPEERGARKPSSQGGGFKPNSGNGGTVTPPVKPSDNSRNSLQRNQSREAESGTGRVISTERTNNSYDRNTQRTSPSSTPSYHQSSPSRPTSPSQPASSGGRSSIRGRD